MRDFLAPLSALLVALLSSACATLPIAEREQKHVALRYQGARLELTQSLWVSPFWRDASRRLVSRWPGTETELLMTPDGQPLWPGESTEVLPAGTRVTVLNVTFPNSWELALRSLMTPREQPWVEFAVDGRPASPAYVIVLRPDLKSEAEALEEIDRWLTERRVSDEVASLPEADQQAVRTKEITPGVGERAVELAWGPALHETRRGEGFSVTRDLTWMSDTTRRSVLVRDGVVAEVREPQPRKVSPE